MPLDVRLSEIETGDPADHIATLITSGVSIVDGVFKCNWVVVNVVHAMSCKQPV